MNGEMAILYQNSKQIGGVFNWSIDIVLDATSKTDGTDWKVTQKKITATGYWLLNKPDTSIYQADFYKEVNGEAVLMQSGIVKIEFPEVNVFDRVLDAPLELEFIKPFDI